MLGANKSAACFPKRFRSLELLTERHWFEFEPWIVHGTVLGRRRLGRSAIRSVTINTNSSEPLLGGSRLLALKSCANVPPDTPGQCIARCQ